MQKINRLLILLVFTGLRIGLLQAQTTTILNQTFQTQAGFNTFTPVSITGVQVWDYNSLYGAVCSGYSSGQSYENEDWLISPAIDLSQMDNVKLSFKHSRGSDAVLNVGVAEGWYKVFATANYTGDPATTQWVELEEFNQDVPYAWQYISSGELVIPDAAKSGNSRIAFRYISSATQSATWEIKDVKVTGEYPDSAGVFKITNWNTEWLGCDTFGPTDENLQINNVASAMLSMNSDIYCIQEVSNTVSNPSIETLVSLMGSDEWAGTIVPSNTGDCNQRQGIIYKKSRVQFVSATELSNGSSEEGNSYYYNCSSGRYPALYNVNLLGGSTTVPVSFINIHAKAEDNDAMSYTRRLGASIALKAILDGASYNTKNLIIIGDFNDYLYGTTSNACNCYNSPYKNFMDDDSHYTGITQYITDADISWGDYPIIENIIISDELVGNYIQGSVAQEVGVSQSIPNYHYTTSDHLPVSAMFEFSTLGVPDNAAHSENKWTIYPNPVKDELNINLPGQAAATTAEIYDLTGRQISCGPLNKNKINVSALPAGVYILRIGNISEKFVKE